MHVVNIIINWYSKLFVVVRWCGQLSATLAVLSGVRQGGILSPIMFNIYVDVILTTLRSRGLGCHIRNCFIGCVMYADDLILLSASVIELQSMLDCCGQIGQDLGIRFNAGKSMCMMIGPNKNCAPTDMDISGATIQWVDRIKYLGVTILSSKVFTIDLKETRRKFFMAANSILSKCTHTSDIVKLDLLEKHCLPILMYAIESITLSKVQLKELNSWLNSVYRRIFGYNKWESVKELILMLGRLDLFHMVNMRQVMFIKRLSNSDNYSMCNLFKYYFYQRQFKSLEDVYHTRTVWSAAKIKAIVNQSFRDLVYPT